jgi:hypothetical protein
VDSSKISRAGTGYKQYKFDVKKFVKYQIEKKIRELGTTFQQLQFESEYNNIRHETARKEYEAERDKLSAI